MSPTTDSYGLKEGWDYSTTFTDQIEQDDNKPKSPVEKGSTGELLFDAKGNFVRANGTGNYSGVIIDGKGNIVNRFLFNDQRDVLGFIDGALTNIDINFDNNINFFVK